MDRKIVHIDMDAFYASVEQRDHPEYRAKPVIVGGNPESRGVVCTCSYEARKYGVHSAMPAARAYKLCPQGIFLSPRMPVYREVSQQIREVFHQYTSLVEPLSLDEAYLDVTGVRSGTLLAQEMKQRILEKTGLTCSAGVSYNKFLAKIASDQNKPDGLTVITPEEAEAFVAALPIRKFFGVGKVTEAKMHQLGIRTGADLREQPLELLEQHFGANASYYYHTARGIDERPVNPSRERKSYGREVTLAEDVLGKEPVLKILEPIAEKLAFEVAKRGLRPYTVTLKIKYADFQLITRSFSEREPILSSELMMQRLWELLQKTEVAKRPIRLVGASLSNFRDQFEDPQLLFPFMYAEEER